MVRWTMVGLPMEGGYGRDLVGVIDGACVEVMDGACVEES